MPDCLAFFSLHVCRVDGVAWTGALLPFRANIPTHVDAELLFSPAYRYLSVLSTLCGQILAKSP
jgi:hypothetical protein